MLKITNGNPVKFQIKTMTMSGSNWSWAEKEDILFHLCKCICTYYISVIEIILFHVQVIECIPTVMFIYRIKCISSISNFVLFLY